MEPITLCVILVAAIILMVGVAAYCESALICALLLALSVYMIIISLLMMSDIGMMSLW